MKAAKQAWERDLANLPPKEEAKWRNKPCDKIATHLNAICSGTAPMIGGVLGRRVLHARNFSTVMIDAGALNIGPDNPEFLVLDIGSYFQYPEGALSPWVYSQYRMSAKERTIYLGDTSGIGATQGAIFSDSFSTVSVADPVVSQLLTSERLQTIQQRYSSVSAQAERMINVSQR